MGVWPVEKLDWMCHALVKSGYAKNLDEATRLLWLRDELHFVASERGIQWTRHRHEGKWPAIRERIRRTYGVDLIDCPELTWIASAKKGDRLRQLTAAPAIADTIARILRDAWCSISKELHKPLPGMKDSYRDLSRRVLQYNPDLIDVQAIVRGEGASSGASRRETPVHRLDGMLVSLASVVVGIKRECRRLQRAHPITRFQGTKVGDPMLNEAAALVARWLGKRHPKGKASWGDVADVLEYHGHKITRRHETPTSRADLVSKAATRGKERATDDALSGRLLLMDFLSDLDSLEAAWNKANPLPGVRTLTLPTD